MSSARASRAALGFALEVPALLLAVQPGPLSAVGITLALLALVGARFGGGRPVPGRLAAAGIHLAGVTAALGGVLLFIPQRPSLGPLVTVAFLGLAIPRTGWGLSSRSRAGILALGLVALMGLARATGRWQFGIGTGAYLGAAVLAILTADRGWPALLRYPRAALGPLVAGLVLAGAVMVGLGWALPVAEPAVSRALQPWIEGGQATSGFGDGDIQLGRITSILTSQTVVMRVHGDTDHLRGQVYVDYYKGRWRSRAQVVNSTRAAEEGRLVFGSRPIARRLLIEAEPEAGPALFAPLNASALVEGPPGSSLTEYGILRFPFELYSEPRSWRLGLADGGGGEHVVRPHVPVAHREPPRVSLDVRLPKHHATRWADLARTWSGGAIGDRERVEALRARLQRGFRYSLDLPKVPGHMDPTWHFVTEGRRGHCELFASALVLLARGVGVPARLVSGYRVFEKNPAGGWYIVRQRDAHAWAEVWLDGAWHTVDPTPAGALAGEQNREAGPIAARWDQFKRWLRATAERLGDLSAGQVVSILAGALALIGLLLLIRRRRRGRTPDGPPIQRFDPLARLEAQLAARHPRAPHQTLLQYAHALRTADQRAPADLVDRCARWLYGGRDDPEAIAAAVDAWLEHP